MGLKADAFFLCFNVISHAQWAQRAREGDAFQQDQVIFKQSPSPQHLAVLFISAHTRLKALICCQYQGMHSVLNTLPPDSLSFSLYLLHYCTISLLWHLLMSLDLFYHPLSPKSYYVLKITRRAASAPNEMTFEVDIPQNHIPIAVTTQHLFVQSIFLTTCRAWSGKIWFHYLYFRHTSPISWQFIHSLRVANSYEFVGMTLT